MINAACTVVLSCAMFAQKADEQKPKDAIPPVEARVKDLTRKEGFLTLYADDAEGTILLQLPASGEQFIYASGLSSGLGSNPVGLDRGQWGRTRLVRFKRVGKRVYLIEENQSYRATANNAAEKLSLIHI